MPQVDAVSSARALDRAVVNGKRDSVSLSQRHYFRPRLHTRALFGDHEFAAGEIAARFGQQDCCLNREYVLAIEVLMETVVVAFAVLEGQRCRFVLPGVVTALKEFGVVFRIAGLNSHPGVPFVCQRRQLRVQGRTKIRDYRWKRVAEVLVFSASKTMAGHYYAAAENIVPRIERSKGGAFFGRQEFGDDCDAAGIEFLYGFGHDTTLDSRS